MPRKQWYQTITDEIRILIRRDSFLGRIRRFSVVLLYRDTGITRYDTAHGYPHRDVMGAAKGKIKSVPCPPEMSYNQAFDFAIRDIEANYEDYLSFYFEN